MLMWDVSVLSGLLLTAIGAGIAASGMIKSYKAVAEFVGSQMDQDIALKAVLLKQSRRGTIGLGLIAIGAFVQMAPILWALTKYS